MIFGGLGQSDGGGRGGGHERIDRGLGTRTGGDRRRQGRGEQAAESDPGRKRPRAAGGGKFSGTDVLR